jgi:hypothetical protein
MQITSQQELLIFLARITTCWLKMASVILLFVWFAAAAGCWCSGGCS